MRRAGEATGLSARQSGAHFIALNWHAARGRRLQAAAAASMRRYDSPFSAGTSCARGCHRGFPFRSMSWQLTPAANFSAHARSWDDLQQRTTNTPFLESHFIGPLLQEFGTGKEVLALHGGANLDAAALVRPAGRGMWETFQPSQLPLGPWLASQQADLPLGLGALVQALPGFALGLGVTQLDPKLMPRPADTAALRILDYIQTSWVDVAGSWDEYWNARGKNLRQNTRKQLNKLASEGMTPTMRCITDPSAVVDALKDYGALESAGWKAGIGTAIHAENAQGRFYTRMLQNFCAAGRGRIYQYCFGDQVVAMDLCIDNGATVVILKTAYDETHRSVSPSTLMRHDEFKSWWDEGRYQRIEFYGKTMEWHTRWTSQERGLYHATAYRWAVLKTVHGQFDSFRRKEPVPTLMPNQTDS